MTARALRSFRDAKGDDWDWVGALLLADALDDMHYVQSFCEAWVNSSKKRGTRRR